MRAGIAHKARAFVLKGSLLRALSSFDPRFAGPRPGQEFEKRTATNPRTDR
jgi:hypothetical protein